MVQEKSVHFRVKKVVSHDNKGLPIIEDYVVKVSPEFQVSRYVNLIHQHNFLSVEVIKVLQRDNEESKFKEVDEIKKWQSMVDDKLKAPEDVKDYKKAYEDQSKDIENLKAQMAELLEAKNATKSETYYPPSEEENKTNYNRIVLEDKAKEHNIDFRSNIGDKKLLEKIQAIEPDFKL